jgi:hypothetical protein
MFVAVFAVGVLLGCAASAPPLTAGSDANTPLGSPFATAPLGSVASGWPLLLDRTDTGIGTSVMFKRVPTLGEIHDLQQEYAFQHLVMVLPAWPAGPEVIEPLQQLEEGTDAIVVLPGYPPSRAAAEAWNLISARVRIVALVDGPPPSYAVIGDLNTMRGLERVVAQMEHPSRAGFERLQRPLSFRKLVD